MAQPIRGRFILGGRGRNLWCNQKEDVIFSAAEGATYGATNKGGAFYFRRSRAQPMAQRFIFAAASDDDDVVDLHRHCDDTRDDYDHADVAVTVWTSDCVRGYARFMLAVWAGRGAQAASCLVIRAAPGRGEEGTPRG